MKDTIEITITREDAEKAGEYYDNKNCLLATCLKRVFPNDKVGAGADIFHLNSVTRYETTLDNKIPNAYNEDRIKVDLENFKPITFTATKI